MSAVGEATGSPAGAEVVRLRGVGFEYAGCGAGIAGIDLVVRAGEVVVLTGLSGSGKSTLARVVNGLVPQFFEGVFSGSAEVAGLDPEREPIARLATVTGSVFQDPKTQFFTGDTTSEMAFGPENLGWAPGLIAERMRATTTSLGLTDLLDRSVLALSGGEQQRLACAVAGMADPAVLVLDEPSSTLDAAAVGRLTGILAEWKRAGKAIVIAEHRLDYLAGLADRFVHLESGRLVAGYSREEFLALGPSRWMEMGLRAPVVSPLPGPRWGDEGDGAHGAGGAGGTDLADGADGTDGTDGTIGSPGEGDAPVGAAGPTPPRGLQLRDVRVRRGRRSVLGIGRAELPLGRPLALIGPNGSGKSTLAHWLAGLRPGAGSLSLDGAAVSRRRRLDTVYLVAQNTNHQLFSETVLGEVRLGWTGRRAGSGEGPTKDEALAILAALDLEHLAGRHPLTLSGGEKQRLVIAVAMASRRRLVILDEPTSGLDARHMRQVAAAIRRLGRGGAAVVIITHDADLVALTCGNAARLDGGTIAETWELDAAGLDRVYAALSPASG